MKIAFNIGSLSKGGAERVITNLANYFYSEGDSVVMVTYFKGEQEYELSKGITRYYADLSKEEITTSRIKNLYRRYKKLRDIWKKENPDIIISFIGKTNLMTIATSRLLKIPVVVSVRSVPEREYASKSLKLGMKLLFPLADGVVLQTKQAKEYFPKHIQKKSAVLPNSLNPKFLENCYEGKRKKEIVSVGRIDSNKNQIMLVKAFEGLLKKSSGFKEWRVLLYGDGPDLKKLQSYISEHGLSDNVICMGAKDNIENYIRESSVFVLTSKQEGMPNALIEAMASGLAVISTDCPCGGPGELIIDGRNGFLIPVDDVDALQNRLETLCNDEEKGIELGAQARKIIDKLNPERVNALWKEYITRISKTYENR